MSASALPAKTQNKRNMLFEQKRPKKHRRHYRP